MAFKSTRSQCALRWRTARNLLAATAALAALQLAITPGSVAQVKAPTKAQLKPGAKPAAASADDVQPFAVGKDGSVVDQLLGLQVDPADAQAAAEAVSKAVGQLDISKGTSSGRAVLKSQGANQPKRLVSLQLFSAKSMAVELFRGNDGSYGYKLAPGATENDDERISSLPRTASQMGAAARSLQVGSVGLVKVSGTSVASGLAQTGASTATLKDLTSALAGFAPAASKIEVLKGRTADGAPRILLAYLGDGKSRQAVWWFAPPNQPEGWFDEQGRRLGGTALADPRPDSRISSPFGTRRYYGRSSGGGFHNGIDYEGKIGEPIYAAADGVINHQGWYFNYGRTVKISHADDFETLYAHMSQFAAGMGPGSPVRKGDVIGYIGSSGRSTGPHLHFSVIVSGQFTDPQPYVTERGGHSTLGGESLVAFRQWQQEVRKAAGNGDGRDRGFRGLQGAEPWSTNPFSSQNVNRL